MKIKNLPKIVISHIPGVNFLYRMSVTRNFLSKGTGGTDAARYCYSVWMRHLVMAERNGLSTHPTTIAELGPGDSLGIGLCAMLTGADRYYAFDVVAYSSVEKNLAILEELLELLKRREDIPGEIEFPTVKPYLDSYDFPAQILTEERLNTTLAKERIEMIREALYNIGHSDDHEIKIAYVAPWHAQELVEENTIDMIFSQAVMEHVEDLNDTYELLHRWLKKDGFMSHQIDFRSHGTARKWNGHWSYSDFQWKLLRGKRTWLINRQPLSTHLQLLERNNFHMVRVKRVEDRSGIKRRRLSPRFQHISDEDLITSGAFIQAAKS